MSGSPSRIRSVQYGTSDEPGLGQCGGPVNIYTPAVALNYGDAVYFSAADTVTKSLVSADYVAFAGIVVGGDLTHMIHHTAEDVALTGTFQVATASGRVIVQWAGPALVITAATPAVGARVIADTTTAGRVLAGTTAGIMLGHMITVSLGAGQLAKMLISLR
jgi:hypothetical protein